MSDASKVDLNRLLLKPVYIGLLMNILVPVILLGIVYYLDSNGYQKGSMKTNLYNIMFWVFCAVAIIEGILAFVFKQRLFFSPMIKANETFEEDLTSGFLTSSIVCYAFTSAIAIYGFLLFFMGGPFETAGLFVLISLIAYQFVRPRFKFAEKVVEAQEKLVAEGRFLQPKK